MEVRLRDARSGAAPRRQLKAGLINPQPAPPPFETAIRGGDPKVTSTTAYKGPGPAWPSVPGYEILGELGRGGMGIVYRARQVSLNRLVALKVLPASIRQFTSAISRFKKEAQAAAKLHHTNIVPVYATGEQDGAHFYAMELIDGPSLDHVIRQLRQERAGPRCGQDLRSACRGCLSQ